MDLQEQFNKLQSILNDTLSDDSGEILQHTEHQTLKEGDTFIPQGAYNKKIAYIKKGIIRVFCHKDNGDEATLLLRWEDQFIASHDSIILNQPSRFTYTAIEHTELIVIDYDILQELIAKNPENENLRNFVLLTMIGSTLKMLENFILLTPEQRYKKLISENFSIVNRVQDKHIASMLGITPVSLSRIRKRMTTRK